MKRSACCGIYGFGLLAMTGLLVCATYAQSSSPATEKKQVASRETLANPPLTGVEKGTYNIYVDTEQKGTEEYDLDPAGNQFVAKGRIHLTITRDEKPIQYFIESELVLKSNYDPV